MTRHHPHHWAMNNHDHGSAVNSLPIQTMSVEEGARLSGVSTDLMYDLARRGEIPVVRLGTRRIRIPIVRFFKEVLGTEICAFQAGDAVNAEPQSEPLPFMLAQLSR